MINVWFTSDFHLGHRNIIRYCNRPFDSIEDMDATLLANLNRKVGENDVLYFLGDFCLGDADQAKLYRDRIVCRNIHMIEGNHDTTLRALAGAFCSWNQLAEIRVGGQRIVLCHYARCGSGIIPPAVCLASLRTFPRKAAGRLRVAVSRHRRGFPSLSTVAFPRNKEDHGSQAARPRTSRRRNER